MHTQDQQLCASLHVKESRWPLFVLVPPLLVLLRLLLVVLVPPLRILDLLLRIRL